MLAELAIHKQRHRLGRRSCKMSEISSLRQSDNVTYCDFVLFIISSAVNIGRRERGEDHDNDDQCHLQLVEKEQAVPSDLLLESCVSGTKTERLTD